VEVWQTSSLWRLRLGEEKKEKKKKLQHENIMVCPIPYGDHNKFSAAAEIGNRLATTDMAAKRGGCCASFGGMGPHLTQCGRGRDLAPC